MFQIVALNMNKTKKFASNFRWQHFWEILKNLFFIIMKQPKWQNILKKLKHSIRFHDYRYNCLKKVLSCFSRMNNQDINEWWWTK